MHNFSIHFLSGRIKFSIEPFMEENKPEVGEKCEFEYRVIKIISKLKNFWTANILKHRLKKGIP